MQELIQNAQDAGRFTATNAKLLKSLKNTKNAVRYIQGSGTAEQETYLSSR